MAISITSPIAKDAAPGIVRPALTLFVMLSLLTGLLYPLAVTGLAQVLFPHAANGSMVRLQGQVAGSELIGQSFSQPGRFPIRSSDSS